jgi:drug/metabolite transporter (DMT)-like permease
VFSTHFLLQTWALEFTTATNTGWIVAASPLTIALLAALVLKEPIPPAMRLGLAIATLGIVLLVSRGELTSLDWLASVGDWLALVSTLTWATYTIVTRDLSRARDPVAVALAMTLPLGAAALVLPWVLDGWTPLATLPAEVIGALVFLGLGGVALAQWFWQIGVARLGAAKAGLFLYLEPLATTALAVPFLGESFGVAAALGGALVLAGVFVAQHRVGRVLE